MKTLEERFFEKVHINTKSGCWEWTAVKVLGGYGRFWTGRNPKMAHRVAYEMTGKEIEEGNDICHTCDNPSCVNPFHLFQGTRKQNMQDMSQKGRADYRQAKLLESEVRLIRMFAKRFPATKKKTAINYGSYKFLSKWFQVDRSIISCIMSGKKWSHIK